MQPIEYIGEVPVRFADLDPYGHVNATHYLDFVISSRWLFAKEKWSITADDFIKKGVGFFMTESRIEYRRGVVGVQRIVVTSHVSKIEGTFKFVSFKIQSLDLSKTFCVGELKFAVMDLGTMKPQAMPVWINDFFFAH